MHDKLKRIKEEIHKQLGDRNFSLLADTLCLIVENHSNEEKLIEVRKAVKGIANEEELKAFFFSKVISSYESWKIFHEKLSALNDEEQYLISSYIICGKKVSIKTLLQMQSFNLIEETLDALGYHSSELYDFLLEVYRMRFQGKGITNIGRGELFCTLFIEDAIKITGKGDISSEGLIIEIKGIDGMYGEQLTGLMSLIKERVSREELERTGEKIPNWQLSNRGIENIAKIIAASNRLITHVTREVLSCYVSTYQQQKDMRVLSICKFLEYSRNVKEIELALKDMFSYIFKKMLHEHLRKNEMLMLCIDATNEKKRKYNRGNAVLFTADDVWKVVKGPFEKGEALVKIVQPSPSSQTGRPSVTL